tara:strand:+ start:129 stop:401 length:273 start_codon:yes stop_codon:yes gene_type:complete
VSPHTALRVPVPRQHEVHGELPRQRRSCVEKRKTGGFQKTRGGEMRLRFFTGRFRQRNSGVSVIADGGEKLFGKEKCQSVVMGISGIGIT